MLCCSLVGSVMKGGGLLVGLLSAGLLAGCEDEEGRCEVAVTLTARGSGRRARATGRQTRTRRRGRMKRLSRLARRRSRGG